MPPTTDSGAGDNEKLDGELSKLPNNERLLRILECPSCYEIPLPPIIRQCVSGHSYCQECTSKFSECPTCLSPFSSTRNFVFEEIIGASSFTCRYKSKGCNASISGEMFNDHVKKCEFINGPKKVYNKTSSNANAAVQIAGACQWVPCVGSLPQDAVEGGFEQGTLLYVARAANNGGIYPGKLYSNIFNIHFPTGEGGREAAVEYEALVSPPGAVEWVTAVDGVIPQGAVIGGRTQLGEALYIGRCGLYECLLIGWIYPGDKHVKVTHEGDVLENPMFEVLVKTEFGMALDLSIN